MKYNKNRRLDTSQVEFLDAKTLKNLLVPRGTKSQQAEGYVEFANAIRRRLKKSQRVGGPKA